MPNDIIKYFRETEERQRGRQLTRQDIDALCRDIWRSGYPLAKGENNGPVQKRKHTKRS